MKCRSRNRRHQTILIDALEARLLFDATITPTPAEQYALELINRARANPVAEITRLANDPTWMGATPDLNEGLPAGTLSPSAEQPVAWNPLLSTGGRSHSQWIIDTQMFQHNEGTAANPITPRDRDIAAGYNFGATGQEGENITSGYVGPSVTNATLQSAVLYSQAIDVTDQGTVGRGHRVNMLNPAWNEIGIGAAIGNYANANDIILTEDYAYAGNGPFLTGVAFNDLNQDGFYEPGEELGGVTITAFNQTTGQTYTDTTWSSGGYSLAVPAGTYSVSATGGNIGTPATQTVTVGNQNVEVDFIAAAAQPTTPTAPVIVNQPQAATVPLGNQAQFSVSFTSNPTATVQWQVSTDGGNTFTNVPGATGTTLQFTTTNTQDGSLYQAVITNSQGTVTSTGVKLSVSGIPLTVLTSPMGQVVNAGDTVTFSATASGSGVTEQWQVSTDGGNTYTNIPGATSSTYTFTADPSQNGNFYKALFTDATGFSTGPAAGLVVVAAPTAPTVTAQPANVAAPAGGDATLAVAANALPAPTVQWQTDATTTATPAALRAVSSSAAAKTGVFTDIPGATGATLKVPVSKIGVTHYRAVITNANGSVTSSVVAVTVNDQPAVSDDLSTLRAAAESALAAIASCKSFTNALVAKLTADFKAIKASKAQKALIAALATSERTSRNRFEEHESAKFRALLGAAGKADSASLRLARDPASTTLKARLQADIAALQAAAGSSTAPADATDCKFATDNELPAISAVAPSNTRLQNDVADGENGAENIGQSLQAPMTIALADADRLMTDAAS